MSNIVKSDDPVAVHWTLATKHSRAHIDFDEQEDTPWYVQVRPSDGSPDWHIPVMYARFGSQEAAFSAARKGARSLDEVVSAFQSAEELAQHAAFALRASGIQQPQKAS